MIKLKLKSGVDGLRIRETPVNGKPIGQLYAGDVFPSCADDSETKQKIGIQGEWLKVENKDGVEGYVAAWLLEYAPESAGSGETPITDDLRTIAGKQPQTGKFRIGVKATTDGIRLRKLPVDGEAVGYANREMVLVSLEDEESTRRKIGSQGEWLKIRAPLGEEAYIAAWLLQNYDGPLPAEPNLPRVLNQTGMNLDINNRLGSPDPTRLKGMGWVRFGYDVSQDRGSEDIKAAYERYTPVLERYAKAGLKVLLVFTHETYGEGKNEFFPWKTMTHDKWVKLTGRLSAMVGQIVAQYAGKDIVHAYQIWNEQDAPIGAVASVPMVAADYGYVLGELIQTIKSVDSNAYVITGGHTGGPYRGADYARTAITSLPDGVLPDGIAFHPYGRGITGPTEPYAIFGHIQESIRAYGAILPDKPLWITEWGVLDRENDNPARILNYANDLVDYIKTVYPTRIAAMIWYAWAMGMHNGYGLVDRNDQPLKPLFEGFRKL